MENSRKYRGKFAEHSRKIRGKFAENSRKVRGKFAESSAQDASKEDGSPHDHFPSLHATTHNRHMHTPQFVLFAPNYEFVLHELPRGQCSHTPAAQGITKEFVDRPDDCSDECHCHARHTASRDTSFLFYGLFIRSHTLFYVFFCFFLTLTGPPTVHGGGKEARCAPRRPTRGPCHRYTLCQTR